MAGVFGRILCRSKSVVSPKKNPLTLSFSTCSEKGARFEKGGWEFSVRTIEREDPESRWNEMTDLSRYENPPRLWNDNVFSIKHPESGVTFRFCAYDAIVKLREEKKTLEPLESNFPSYDSPLLPFDCEHYDSAYVGRTLIEKPGKLVRNLDLKWQDIDLNTLEEQIGWTTMNKPISSLPDRYCYTGDDGQLTFFDHKRAAKKSKPVNPNRKVLLESVLNTMMPLYEYHYCGPICRQGEATCQLFLVVTESAWFAYLKQLFSNKHGAVRTREMTMHCAFERNVVYREITERQSKDFLRRLSTGGTNFMVDEGDLDMIVLFHEAKQFRKLETKGVSKPRRVRDATQYGSFAIDTPTPGDYASSLMDLPLPDSVVESIVATGKPIQFLKKQHCGDLTKIIPLFSHPCNPFIPSEYPGPFPRQTPRKVYVQLDLLNFSDPSILLERTSEMAETEVS